MPREVTSTSRAYYTIRRLIEAIPIFFAVIIINFLIVNLAPGDPALYMIGQFGVSSPEILQMLRTRYGLDRPLYERLFVHLANVARGDLGFSTYFESPVTSIIMQSLPSTLLLVGSAILFSTIFGIMLGVISAKRPYSLTDTTITVASVIAYSLPLFWLAQILIIAFSLKMGWFPVQGMVSTRVESKDFAYALDVMHHLFLPGVTLGLFRLSLIARLTRGSMLEVLREDYILTAWAKGLRSRQVYYKHALKNAILPIVTLVGYEMGFMFAGATLTETVFGWPGIGRLMFDSLLRRDYPMILGIFAFVTTAVIIANLVTDIIYSYVDPRIRYK